MRLLITGGCGFIGHHVVEHFLKSTSPCEIIIIDKLNYASTGFDRLRDIKVYDDKRITILTRDFAQPMVSGYLLNEIGAIDYIIHLGAETHVDRSIDKPEPFVLSNVLGTMHVLNLARYFKNSLIRMIYFSTDEIFGPAPGKVRYKEWDRYNSTNPYSATKAGGEELCLAYANTYKVPVTITHTMNVFGERQHPEKFIPMTIKKILKDEVVKIHSDPTCKIPGSRFWIHARNVARALEFIMVNGEVREKYNIVGEEEVNNLEMAKLIALYMGKGVKTQMVNFHESRPGHDLRYALCGEKLKMMGFEYPIDFNDSLKKTIQWTLANQRWLKV